MEEKILIFIIATVVIVAVILGITLPPLLRNGKAETAEPTIAGKPKKVNNN
jgi:NhaP-type Na+/H+ or K+/H+ antiporter